MRLENKLFQLLGVNSKRPSDVKKVAENLGISVERLRYYNDSNILPCNYDLVQIEKTFKLNRVQIMLAMGIMNCEILKALSERHEDITRLLNLTPSYVSGERIEPIFQTEFGNLYHGDCISLLNQLENKSVDLVFADPPFNLDKMYESGINDNLSKEDYLEWCERWLDGCIRILKDGGSLFVWNIPKWNTYISDYLNRRLSFKHWIAVDIKYSLPVQGKLYPSHYSLLYYVKGERANYFKSDRLPMEVCKSCFKEIKDYGGYKDKMNPKGINIADVWYDIPPVRHSKYKNREANELSIRLLDRIIEMSSKPGDTVFDPFGGSGTTYIVSEIKKRKWIGIELGSINDIVSRFNNMTQEVKQLESIRKNYNVLFTEDVKNRRKQCKLWTDETFNSKSKAQSTK